MCLQCERAESDYLILFQTARIIAKAARCSEHLKKFADHTLERDMLSSMQARIDLQASQTPNQIAYIDGSMPSLE